MARIIGKSETPGRTIVYTIVRTTVRKAGRVSKAENCGKLDFLTAPNSG